MGFSCLAPCAGVVWNGAAPWSRAAALEAVVSGRRLARRSMDFVDAMMRRELLGQVYGIRLRDDQSTLQ